MTKDNNIHPITSARSPQSSGGSGGGNDLNVRVSVIEAELKHLAKKSDIEEVKTLIASTESKLQRWLIGILIAAMLSMTFALIKTFS